MFIKKAKTSIDITIKHAEGVTKIYHEQKLRGLFHQVNISAEGSVVSMTFVRTCFFEMFDRPPYSPGLISTDYLLFSNMKYHLTENKYRSEDDVISLAVPLLLTRCKCIHQ